MTEAPRIVNLSNLKDVDRYLDEKYGRVIPMEMPIAAFIGAVLGAACGYFFGFGDAAQQTMLAITRGAVSFAIIGGLAYLFPRLIIIQLEERRLENSAKDQK